MNDSNVIRFKGRPELAAEGRRDEIAAATGFTAKVTTHSDLMKLDPDTSPAVIQVYQDYYNDPDNHDK